MLRRQILASFFTGLLLVSSAVGVNAAAVQKINLDDAVKQALAGNADIVPATFDLELARIDLQRTEADQALSPNPSQLRQKRLALKKAEDSLRTVENKVRREVSDQAFNVLKAQETVKLNELKASQSANDLATTKLKVDLKVDSNVSLLNAQKNLISAQKSLADSITSLNVAKMNFLKYIGATDITVPFELEVSDFKLEQETFDLAQATEQALAHTSRVVSAQEQLEGAELDMKLNDAGFTPTTDRRKYEIAVAKAKRTLEEEQKQTRVQMVQYLSDLASLQKDLAAAELALQVAEEQLVSAQVKFAQGMVTETQFKTQESTLTQSRQSLLDAKMKIRDKQQEIHDYLGV